MPASIKHLTSRKVSYNSLLAKWKDGLYYTAALIKCDRPNKKCLVCFEDGSEIWASNRDIHIQLSIDQLSEEEDIVCCICDDGSSEPPNEIILCDVCQQGYHQKCHQPPVDSSKIDESEDTNDHKDWFCSTCSYILNQTSDDNKPSTSASKAEPKATANQVTNSQPSVINKSAPSPQQNQKSMKTNVVSPQQQPDVEQQQKPIVAPQQKPVVTAQPKPANSPQPKPAVIPQPKQAPYYPLSSQVRAATTSSTAALASMTASSALVVGSSAGRTKPTSTKPPVVEAVANRQKHAVRKSCANYVVPPVRQSALPTAIRSPIQVSPSPKPLANPTPATGAVGSVRTLNSAPPTKHETGDSPVKNNSSNNNNQSPVVGSNQDKQSSTMAGPPYKILAVEKSSGVQPVAVSVREPQADNSSGIPTSAKPTVIVSANPGNVGQ